MKGMHAQEREEGGEGNILGGDTYHSCAGVRMCNALDLVRDTAAFNMGVVGARGLGVRRRNHLRPHVAVLTGDCVGGGGGVGCTLVNTLAMRGIGGTMGGGGEAHQSSAGVQCVFHSGPLETNMVSLSRRCSWVFVGRGPPERCCSSAVAKRWRGVRHCVCL